MSNYKWLKEVLEAELALIKESNSTNDINHPEYIKGIIYGIRYALKSLEYGIEQGKI